VARNDIICEYGHVGLAGRVNPTDVAVCIANMDAARGHSHSHIHGMHILILLLVAVGVVHFDYVKWHWWGGRVTKTFKQCGDCSGEEPKNGYVRQIRLIF